MKLVPNARAIAARSHSMWAIYLGIVVLWLGDVIYWITGVDTNPRVWFWLSMACFAYGVFGRVLRQGIEHPKDRNTFHSPPWVGLIALIALLGGGIWMSQEPSAIERTEAQPIEAEASPDATQAFLDHAFPLVAKWEGLRLEAYLDPVGIPTVCYGETKGVKLGDRYTEAECRAMLERELVSYRTGLHGYFLPETISARLPPTRAAAYGSLAYNVGVAGAGKSTATRRLNAGDIAGGCEALTWWNKAGGRVLRGLVRRRAEERDLCLIGASV
ncbi:lysozyme [Pacificoceanicola onchidii]|uniref:lysozyme n=1 Tax=Pacificoceanicola onchidii TaxID=2562685 RepID=UPI0010A4FC2A|nr:lysozyme [Pacificoceanicola onchidii]